MYALPVEVLEHVFHYLLLPCILVIGHYDYRGLVSQASAYSLGAYHFRRGVVGKHGILAVYKVGILIEDIH